MPVFQESLERPPLSLSSHGSQQAIEEQIQKVRKLVMQIISITTSHPRLSRLCHANNQDQPTSPFAMDTDIGTELFVGYENDFKLIVADISSKLQALQDQDGEARKASVRAAERSGEEAEEIVRTPRISAPADTRYR